MSESSFVDESLHYARIYALHLGVGESRQNCSVTVPITMSTAATPFLDHRLGFITRPHSRTGFHTK